MRAMGQRLGSPPVSRWRIDTGNTSFKVTFKPGVPGVGLRVRGITGTFEASLDERGQPDLDLPVEGEFEVTVDDLSLGPPILDRAVRGFLGGDDAMAARGWMGDVQPEGDDRYRFKLELELRGVKDTIDAVGTTALQPDGTVKVRGTSEVNPKRLGIPIPRLLPLTCRAAWDLRILPDD
jgi:hypothetical protein